MPEPSVPMTLLNEGENAVISSFHLPDSLKKRLFSMGIIPETRIECIRRKKGSLIAIKARGAVIALRFSDAACILIRKTK